MRKPPTKRTPKTYPSWQNTKVVSLRLKLEDYQILSEAAEEAKVSVSTYIREWLEEQLSSEDS